jgi:hypothetical protein
MHPHRLTVFSVALTLVMFLANAASAQVTDRMKATAPEKDDASRQGGENARVQKADGSTKEQNGGPLSLHR